MRLSVRLSKFWVWIGLAIALLGSASVRSVPLPRANCGTSLFREDHLSPEVRKAQERFWSLTHTFQPDDNIDIIFEVTIRQQSTADIESQITESQIDYFKPRELKRNDDGFARTYNSTDGEWKKTIKVTTQNFDGEAIAPYLQIFYEDRYGGVIRLKPNGNPNAPDPLIHLRSPRRTTYFKIDPDGDLSWANEAFKIDRLQPLPKSPQFVNFPQKIKLGTPAAEAFLQQCWTFRTHIPLDD